MMEKLSWFGCYDGSWQSAPLVPEAYAHPAKVSFNLAERIYRHMLAEGWLAPNAHVIDPFGGIGGLAFHAALYGMHWTGVELEPKFVDLAQQNIDLWAARYAPHFPGYGSARIMQGDSRRLAALVGGADGAVSSPPYSGKPQEGQVVERDRRRLIAAGREDLLERLSTEFRGSDTYGSTPGQLGAMPTGDLDAAVSSPPYASNTVHDGNGIDASKLTGNRPGKHSQALTMTGYSAAISSPPFVDGLPQQDRSFSAPHDSTRNLQDATYGDSAGQVGAMESDTFWAAAKEIVAQTYAVLKPGAVAAWITGDFVRNKQRVPFGEQWLALCESVGFEPLAWAVAWKQTDHGAQLDIFGEAIPQQTTRVSFFRRLANAKNPDAAILNEDVIFVRKPGGAGRGLDGAVSSPPYAETETCGNRKELTKYDSGEQRQRDYGNHPGQLGAMPAGAAPGKETP